MLRKIQGFLKRSYHHERCVYAECIQEDTELSRRMHDLHCKNAEDMHSKILADRVYELKETQKGVEFMCREMEQIYNEGFKVGEKLGIEKGERNRSFPC